RLPGQPPPAGVEAVAFRHALPGAAGPDPADPKFRHAPPFFTPSSPSAAGLPAAPPAWPSRTSRTSTARKLNLRRNAFHARLRRIGALTRPPSSASATRNCSPIGRPLLELPAVSHPDSDAHAVGRADAGPGGEGRDACRARVCEVGLLLGQVPNEAPLPLQV